MTVDPAGLMTVGLTYNADGGTISGPGYVDSGTLEVTASPAGGVPILVDGSTALATNNLAGTTIDVQGNNVFGLNTNATLTAANGLTNDGTILLQSISGGYSDTLTLAGTFTNAADGTIQIGVGTGGSRTLAGSLTNQGLLTVASGEQLSGSGSVTNTGTVTKSADSGTATIAITYGGTGSVVVPAGTLQFTGTFSNLANNTLTGGTYSLQGTLRPAQRQHPDRCRQHHPQRLRLGHHRSKRQQRPGRSGGRHQRGQFHAPRGPEFQRERGLQQRGQRHGRLQQHLHGAPRRHYSAAGSEPRKLLSVRRLRKRPDRDQ